MTDKTENNDIAEFIAEVEKTSPYISWEEGEPVKGIFKGAKQVDDEFNAGQTTMEYTLEVDKVEKTFKSKSVKLARLLAGFKIGDNLQLVKTGESFKTIWYVEKAK